VRYYRKVLARVEERLETSRVVCDRCQQAISDDNTIWDGNQVLVEARFGLASPQEAEKQRIETVDCCTECWVVLRALVEAGGFRFQVYDADEKEVVLETDEESGAPIAAAGEKP